MSLFKYYKRGVVLPACIILAGYLLYVVIFIAFDLGRNEKSEWLDANTAIVYSFFIVFLNSIVYGLLSTGIFLNYYERVRENKVYSIISWILLPSLWSVYLVSKHFHYLTQVGFNMDEESLFIFSNVVPYLTGLCISCVQFTKENRKRLRQSFY